MSDFTAQDYRQLSEALETHDKHGRNMEDYEMFVGAARRFRDRYQICQTCDGGGYLPIPDEPEFDVDTDCPDCVGGLVPNQKRLEQAQKAINDCFDDGYVSDWTEEATAAVRAFDKESQ